MYAVVPSPLASVVHRPAPLPRLIAEAFVTTPAVITGVGLALVVAVSCHACGGRL